MSNEEKAQYSARLKEKGYTDSDARHAMIYDLDHADKENRQSLYNKLSGASKKAGEGDKTEMEKLEKAYKEKAVKMKAKRAAGESPQQAGSVRSETNADCIASR